MTGDDSHTNWIEAFQAGDRAAASPLWEHYHQRLLALARRKLESAPRRAADEEDIVVSAFASFCRGVEEGRFERLNSRDDLWKLLVVITARKAFHWMRDETRLKRNRGQTLGEDALEAGGASESLGLALHQVIAREPTPEFALQVAEEYQRLLDLLADEELKQIATWKMEGYLNEEIAERLNCVNRTVERRLNLIRSLWSRELDS